MPSFLKANPDMFQLIPFTPTFYLRKNNCFNTPLLPFSCPIAHTSRYKYKFVKPRVEGELEKILKIKTIAKAYVTYKLPKTPAITFHPNPPSSLSLLQKSKYFHIPLLTAKVCFLLPKPVIKQFCRNL